MRKTFARITLGVLLVSALCGAVFVYGLYAAVDEIFIPPVYTTDTSTAPELSAKSWLVFDVEMGEVLYEYNADDPLPIASVTKLATAARFLEEGNIDATTTIAWSDVITDGRAGKLSAGEVYTNHELLFPLLLESSNDAASTLERVDAALLERMNSYAEELSLDSTSFKDGSGLSDQNVSTARDLLVLSRHIFITEPHIFDVTRVKEYYSEDNGWINNNPFVDDPSYRGGKHGFTYEANRTVVAFFDELINGGSVRTLGYILLGSDDLEGDMSALRQHVREHTSYE